MKSIKIIDTRIQAIKERIQGLDNDLLTVESIKEGLSVMNKINIENARITELMWTKL